MCRHHFGRQRQTFANKVILKFRDISEKRVPQTAAKLSSPRNWSTDFQIYPTLYGEKIVMRISIVECHAGIDAPATTRLKGSIARSDLPLYGYDSTDPALIIIIVGLWGR